MPISYAFPSQALRRNSWVFRAVCRVPRRQRYSGRSPENSTFAARSRHHLRRDYANARQRYCDAVRPSPATQPVPPSAQTTTYDWRLPHPETPTVYSARSGGEYR